MEVDKEWLWTILWTDEALFRLTGYINTQNCRIWATENPLETQPAPLHPTKVTVRCEFMASFIIDSYFFEEMGALSLVNVTVTGQRYECFCATTSFQFFSSVDVWIGSYLCKMALLSTLQIQWNSCWWSISEILRIISLHFLTAWPYRSPDLNPCDFWLWGYLKDIVFSTLIAHLAELKACIAQHIQSVTPQTLR